MDEAYIHRVLKGDTQAFRYLVRRYQAMAMRTAMSMVKNESDAKDVVQISFIQAYESLHSFRRESKFSTWICRIVINNSIKFIQKRKRKYEQREGSPLASSDAFSYNQGLLSLDRNDVEQLLKKGLARLSPNESLIIQLYYLEEYRLEEIEQITDFSRSNIKVLLHRARKNLYKHLVKSYENMN